MRLKTPAHSCPLDLRIWFRPLSLRITQSHLMHGRNELTDFGFAQGLQFPPLWVQGGHWCDGFLVWVIMVDVISRMKLFVLYLNNPGITFWVFWFHWIYFWHNKKIPPALFWKKKSQCVFAHPIICVTMFLTRTINCCLAFNALTVVFIAAYTRCYT